MEGVLVKKMVVWGGIEKTQRKRKREEEDERDVSAEKPTMPLHFIEKLQKCPCICAKNYSSLTLFIISHKK